MEIFRTTGSKNARGIKYLNRWTIRRFNGLMYEKRVSKSIFTSEKKS